MSTFLEWYYHNTGAFVVALLAVLFSIITVLFAIAKHDMLYAIINVILFVPIALLIARSWATQAKHGVESMHITPRSAFKIVRGLRSSRPEVRSHRRTRKYATD